MPHEFITLPKKAKDITNQRFGRLIVLGPVKHHNRAIKWLCQCDCGDFAITSTACLRSGDTLSCGCLKKELIARRGTIHGLHDDPLYTVWGHIVQRCTNPSNRNFVNYGGRGITICDEWRHDFQAFYDHVTKLPHCRESGYSIDRADNSVGYFPGNIRFATATDQSRNKRDNVMIAHNGKTQCLSAWALELGINRETLRGRFRLGWSIEHAFLTPPKATRQNLASP